MKRKIIWSKPSLFVGGSNLLVFGQAWATWLICLSWSFFQTSSPIRRGWKYVKIDWSWKKEEVNRREKVDSFIKNQRKGSGFQRLLFKGLKTHVISVPFRFQQWTCNLNLGVFRKGGTARGRSQDTQSVLDVVFLFVGCLGHQRHPKYYNIWIAIIIFQITTTQVIPGNWTHEDDVSYYESLVFRLFLRRPLLNSSLLGTFEY